MKKLDFTLGLLLASLGSSLAQVTVEVVLDQDQFLASEPLVATVRVTNRSGQTVRLGAEPDWLTLSVEAREGFIVSQIGELPVTGESLLESSKVVPIRVNLARCFNLTKPGRYSVTASVRIKQWDREFSSRPKAFDIVRGSKLWEQDFGVPPSSDTNAANPEVRKYALQQANYLKELRLYARLTDATESRVFRVFPVGSMVSFSRPEAQVDGQSNLHVLFQSGARAFTYCVISPNGEIVLRQRHDYSNTRPRLQADAEGKLGVVGGAQRVTADDLPAPATTSATNDGEIPKR
jgi:hypothetical protein